MSKWISDICYFRNRINKSHKNFISKLVIDIWQNIQKKSEPLTQVLILLACERT